MSVQIVSSVKLPSSSAEFARIQLHELEAAAALVHEVMPATPLYAWPKLAQRTASQVFVKHENHTPTGAFKVRGGIVYLNRLSAADPPVPGVISATRGNHGQSIAYAAARAGIAATVYVPKGNSPDQNSAIEAFGATVVEFGDHFDAARHEAMRVATAQGLHMIPSFHRDLVVGVGTYALEMFREAANLHAVYVGVGMGSGICGLIAGARCAGIVHRHHRSGSLQRAGDCTVLRRRPGDARDVVKHVCGWTCDSRTQRRRHGNDLPRGDAIRASDRG